MKRQKTISLILAAALLGGISSGVIAGDKGKEKCYGVAKAGKNDCQTKTSSCAGTSKKDAQRDAFVVVPKGLCSRLVGSSAGTPRS